MWADKYNSAMSLAAGMPIPEAERKVKVQMKKYADKFTELLKGKTIKRVEYFTDVEMNELGWHRNPAIIIFTDGTFLYGMRDDEGNDGGSIYYSGDTNEIIHPI